VTASTRTVEIAGLAIEYDWIEASASPPPGAPLMVFLHEGLGSRAMWKDFPARLCQTVGFRGLVYSRPGYGRSTPRAANERWATDFMHRQAIEVLPALLEALGVEQRRQRLWFFGHSDGASIALIYAAHFPDRVAGAVVLAPHSFVEDIAIASIERACDAYVNQGLRAKLARWHDDVDSAFYGWSQAWLDPAFRDWTLMPELESIACPLLAIQGVDDEYGTMAQIATIERTVPGTTVVALDDCGHSPHRDQADAVIGAVDRWIVTTFNTPAPSPQ
jgi:pimeloyl-ACP methyl ester carboxylesterase